MMQKTARSRQGSIFVIIILTICILLVPLLIMAVQVSLYSVDRTRLQAIVEAAGLLAANDVSRITINDPNFGYVALSNYPPIGKGTYAADGEPLPVTGINTLTATIRQNTIIAHELCNEKMIALTTDDRVNLRSTHQSMDAAIQSALSASSRESFKDPQGETVEPLKDVIAFLQAQLPDKVKVESVNLSNGWLTRGGRTTATVPEPASLAQMHPNQSDHGEYLPFVNIPASGCDFAFAALGPSSRLVPTADFRPDDGKHLCSIVKIECTLVVHRAHPFAAESMSKVRCIACCQPFSSPDTSTSGVLTLRFSRGPVSGLKSWNDFLKDLNFKDSQISKFVAVQGDYPTDKEARMARLATDEGTTTAGQFGEHLYYWLRNGHVKPRIDSVLSMVNESFPSGPRQIYVYEFARDGSISRRVLARDPFAVAVTADCQSSCVCDTSIQNGVTPIIIFRNNVKSLGTAHGGKHAGQPLAGNPLNWCELEEYGGSELEAARLGKGKKGTGLSVTDSSPDNGQSNFFKSIDLKTLFAQPRKNVYSGGLAMDIEIGGTNITTASLDLNRMRMLRR